MGFAIVFFASIPAYLFGIASFLMGAGVLSSLGLVAASGTALAMLMTLGVFALDPLARLVARRAPHPEQPHPEQIVR